MEAVYLNNDEALNLQTNEDHHIFQWLKLQARRGAAEAEVPHFILPGSLRHLRESIQMSYTDLGNLWGFNPFMITLSDSVMLRSGVDCVHHHVLLQIPSFFLLLQNLLFIWLHVWNCCRGQEVTEHVCPMGHVFSFTVFFFMVVHHNGKIHCFFSKGASVNNSCLRKAEHSPEHWSRARSQQREPWTDNLFAGPLFLWCRLFFITWLKSTLEPSFTICQINAHITSVFY